MGTAPVFVVIIRRFIMNKGFITIPRSIDRFEIFDDLDALGFYTRLKSYLRFREGVIDGIKVGPNSFLISKPDLAQRTNISLAKVRRLLKQFQEVGGIKCENIKNKYTLITFLEPFLADVRVPSETNGNPSPAEAVTDTDTYSEASGDEADDKKDFSSERGELKVYGVMKNLYLSDDEYSSLRRDYRNVDYVLDKLSSFIENFPEKNERNHYAQAIRWLLNEKDVNRADEALRDSQRGYTPEPRPDPNASYDLLRAEARAKAQVPRIRKREW